MARKTTLIQLSSTITKKSLIYLKLFLLFLLIMECSTSYCQINMHQKSLGGITFSKISNTEKNLLLKQIGTESQGKEDDSNKYYVLKDGRVIYEIVTIVNYIFHNKQDYEQFLQVTSKPILDDKNLTTYTHEINNEDFVSDYPKYADAFLSEYHLKLDYSSIQTIKILDKELNSLNFEALLNRRVSIISIVTEYVLNLSQNAIVRNVNDGQQKLHPLIFVDGKTLIDPATLVYEELNKYSNKRQKINLFLKIKRTLDGI